MAKIIITEGKWQPLNIAHPQSSKILKVLLFSAQQDVEKPSTVPRVDPEALQTGGGVYTSCWLSATPAEATSLC